MISEETRRRISLLQRGEAPARKARVADQDAAASSDLIAHFPEGEVCQTPYGDVFACQAPLQDIYSGAAKLLPRYLGVFEQAAQMAGQDSLSGYLAPLAGTAAEETALIDTETAGLHGRPLFLIGLARYRSGEVIVTQYFARSYAEEAGILARLGAALPELRLLISFNGKAFDWPFVRDRMTYHRLHCEAAFAHLDLLHPSRRRWRAHLPDCKLRTLERYLSGRWRSGDIPGDQIPQRYHDYVRDPDARLIAPIFHHNRLDLIAMMELLIALVEAEQPRTSRPGPSGSTGRGRVAGEEGSD